jgi:septal ring factor EnvC (AmiA/AmiB activator)
MAAKKQTKTRKASLNTILSTVEHGFSDLEGKMDRKFSAIAEDITEIKSTMATKGDVRGIVREELKSIETRLAAVEGKVAGIDRRLDAEAMRRDGEKIPVRVDKLEKKVSGTHR